MTKSSSLFVALGFFFSTSCYAQEDQQLSAIYNLSLEELTKIKIKRPAALTKTTERLIPASVTTVTADDIRISGARSLNELLENYVPGLQVLNHLFGFNHMGMRGIMSDRDDKFLFLVNGRTLNERMLVGAISERDLVMLGDIHHVDVIRGAGSATYGLGAVSMVINVVTHDGNTFQGNESRTRAGVGEDFISQEIRYGHKTDDKHHFFFYAGIADYQGGDYKSAPLRYSVTSPTKKGNFVEAENDIDFDIGSNKKQYRDIPPLKFHAELTIDDFEFWARYTRGGTQKPMNIGGTLAPPIGSNNTVTDENKLSPPLELGYQQLTFSSSYHQNISPQLQLDYTLSYDLHDYERRIQSAGRQRGIVAQSQREDEFFGRAVTHWEPNPNYSLATGFEITHEHFGLRSPGFPNNPAVVEGSGNAAPDWHTNTFSIYGEQQWKISPAWTSFISARFDNHTYTDTLFSPRLSFIYTPNEQDTIKLLLGRSQRMNFALEMRKDNQNEGIDDSEPETLDSAEIRWEHMFNREFSSAVVVYREHLDLIGLFDGRQQVIADEEQWGIEFELSWKNGPFSLDFSHTYTELDKFDLRTGVTTSFVTTMPNGYGNDLSNWSNHLTKLRGLYRINNQWVIHGSLVYYWYFDGMKESIDFRVVERNNVRYTPGNSQIYDKNLYLNLGAEYRYNEDLSVGITGHNLMGLVSKRYNKRNYFNQISMYRLQAAALSATLNWTFD